MKNRLTLLSLFITLCSISHAQIGIQQHATWHYYWDNQFLFGTIKTKYVSDTVIEGENAKKLVSKKYKFVYDQSGSYSFSDSSEIRTDYIITNQDSVFWWDGNSFELILDYSTQAGDTRNSIYFNNSSFPYCDSMSTFETVSTSQLFLGSNFRNIYINSPITSPLRLHGNYNERIGCIETNNGYSWFLPIQGWCEIGDPNLIPEEAPNFGFRCYQDDSLFYNPSGVDCDYYLNNLNLYEKNLGKALIYPQPFSSTLTIDLNQNYQEGMRYQVHDLLGNLVAKGDISQEKNTISLTFLQNGVYTLSILDARNTTLSQSKLIKQD